MRLRRWRLREMIGTGLAWAVVAVPLRWLAHAELAEHSVWTKSPGASWVAIALAWTVVASMAADAARRLPADEGSGG